MAREERLEVELRWRERRLYVTGEARGGREVRLRWRERRARGKVRVA